MAGMLGNDLCNGWWCVGRDCLFISPFQLGNAKLPMFVDSLTVFVIVAKRILRLISLSESPDMGPAQLQDRGQEPGQSSVGPPHLAWARQGQSSASASRVGVSAPGKSSGHQVSTSFALFLLLWPMG